jgi:hypothetical protein
MSATTSVPDIEFTPTGIVLPTEAEILAGVNEDQSGAFGGDVNPDPKTPQGQLATSTTAIIADKNSVIAELVDQVDPDNATGFMQDAIGRIYFLNRNPAVATVVQLQCGGNLGTPIPVGAQARDTSGNIYACTLAGVIPVGGSITLPFANIITGPIPAPANTVNKIYLAIPGWDTVNNSVDGVVGSPVESAADFEFRRQNSVAKNANGSIQAVYGEVFSVPGVIDCFVSENVTGSPISGPINGNPNSTNFTLKAHSIYVAVTGGLATDVANAIWIKKNEGSDMNGNTTIVVPDTSGYSFPQPMYNITFEIPDPTPYALIVNIKSTSALPSTIVADVQNACVAQFNGVMGVPQANGIIPSTSGGRVRIGSLLLAASFYGPVATCEGPSVPVSVLSIFIGSVFSGTATLVVSSEVITIATVGAGSVTPGTVIAGTDIPANTTIVKQLTGAIGGPGTYQMSANATSTVSSPEAVTGVGGTSQQVGIDQQPTLANTSVIVNLV